MAKRIAGQIQGGGVRQIAALFGHSDNAGDARLDRVSLVVYVRQAPRPDDPRVTPMAAVHPAPRPSIQPNRPWPKVVAADGPIRRTRA